MSVYPWDQTRVSADMAPNAIRHVLVAIRGIDMTMRAQFGTRYFREQREWTPFYDRFYRLRGNVEMSLFHGSLDDRNHTCVSPVVDVVKQGFHAASKVIIYGFSAGAYNALEVCRKLESFRYNYDTRRLEPDDRKPTAERPRLIVDLLLTIDPVKIQLTAESRNRPEWSLRVSRCVRWNLNYYQTSNDPQGHGGPTTPAWAGQVIDTNLGDRFRHMEMNNVTGDWALGAAQHVLQDRAGPPLAKLGPERRLDPDREAPARTRFVPTPLLRGPANRQL